MTDEYIRKQDAVDAFNRAVQDVGILDADDIKTVFGMLSSADVVWVRHGRWVKEHWHGETTRMCSVCHITQTVNVYNGEVKFNYCPYCGAKMDKE